MDRRSRPGPEPSAGDQWRYALVVVQAGDDEDDDDLSSRSCRTAVIVLSQAIVRFTKPEPETWVLCFKLETQV